MTPAAIISPRGLRVPTPARQNGERCALRATSRSQGLLRRFVNRRFSDPAQHLSDLPPRIRRFARPQDRNPQCDQHTPGSGHHSQSEKPASACRRAIAERLKIIHQLRPWPAKDEVRFAPPTGEHWGLVRDESVRSRHSYRPESSQVGNARGASWRDRQINARPAHLVQHPSNGLALCIGRRAYGGNQCLPGFFFERPPIARRLLPQILLNVVWKLADRQTRHQPSPDCNAINVCNDIKVSNAQTY